MEKLTILTITGSDGTSESGIQADLKTIGALDCYAVTVITSITLQNTLGIQRFYDIPADVVAGQIEAIVNDIEPAVVKIGMIRNIETLQVVVDALVKYQPRHVVFDAVLHSFANESLMAANVVSQIRARLLPLCSVVIVRRRDGDWIGSAGEASVCVVEEHGRHGVSNVFASVVAVYLGKGYSRVDAIDRAQTYVDQFLSSPNFLQGRSGELYHAFIKLLAEHAAHNRDVQFYADCLNVSSRYLAQVCKRLVEKAPKAIIDEYLVEKIAQRLANTEDAMQQMAYDYAFSSQAHLTRFFKKQTHLSPTEYRRKFQENQINKPNGNGK